MEVILKDELVIRPVPRRNSPTLLRSLMRHQSSIRMNVPNKWLHFHSLKPGDRVEVITNGVLIVRPLAKERKPTEALDVLCPKAFEIPNTEKGPR